MDRRGSSPDDVLFYSDIDLRALEQVPLVWPIFIITLEPNGSRAAYAQAQMRDEKLPFRLIRAVDGSTLHRKQIEDVFDRDRNKRIYKYPLTAPEIGCYLSHIKLWDQIARSSDDGAFIFEDDFKAVPGFGDLLRKISATKFNADIVSLHQSRRPLHRHYKTLNEKYSLVEPLIAPPRTTGYGITKTAALSLSQCAVPFARPVDIDLKHWWESGIRYLTVLPSPLIEETAGSSIGPQRVLQRNTLPKMTRFLRNTHYQARYHTNLLKARLFRKSSLHRTRFKPQAAAEVRMFKGHSGCSVTLCRSGNDYFIRKMSSSSDYNDRLLGQMQKQASSRRLVRAPRVRDYGYKNGLMFFDMDYVADNDFFSQLASETVGGVTKLVERILDVLENFLGHPSSYIAPEKFETKVNDVIAAVRRHPQYAGCRDTLDRVADDLAHAQWDGIPQTESHGDLTLENMLFASNGTITLIDFLDGDLSSAWLDFAKLLYDLGSGWSLRERLDKNALTADDRLVVLMSRYLDQEIRLHAQTKFSDLWRRLPQLELLQAMRVLPYVRDQRTFSRVTTFMHGVHVL